MTVYAWPAAWQPSAFELRVMPNLRTFTGPYTPTVQVIDLLGERWQGRMDLPPTASLDEAGAREAFFDRLKGVAHQFTLWNFRRPTPRGTARGAMTLAASAMQLANSVSVGGCQAINAVLGGSFETDANSDGVADGWTRYSNGSTGALSASLSTTAVVHGTYSQQFFAAALGATNADRNGGKQTGINVAHLAGQMVTLAASMAGTVGTGLMLYIQFQDGSGAAIAGADLFSLPTATGVAQAVSVTGACPSNASTATVFIYQHSGSGTSAGLLVDAVQLVAGAAAGAYPAPATLNAGDMLGVNGQLVRVMADAVANDAGVCMVEVQPRLRTAQSSGAAVTWNRPTMNAMLKSSDGVATTYRPGYADGCSFEFVEVP